jgi:phosphoglucosamine mutase
VIVIDCANGPSSIAAHMLYDNAIIFNDNLKDEINLNCGSTHPNNILRLVNECKANIGFTFDGDGDRVNAVSKKGRLIDGDYLCYLLARYYKVDKVVLTRMANNGLIRAFKKIGIDVYLSDVGDKNVYKMMLDNNIMLGSEASGHIINLSLDILGDAVLNSLIIVNALECLNITLDDIYDEIDIVPSILKNYYIDNLNIDLSGFSDVDIFVRKSGTENCYRVFLQCSNQTRLDECINYIDEKMRNI